MLNQGAVVACGLIVKFAAMQDSAALGVGCPEDHAADTGKTDGTRAHRAGFQRDIQIIFRDSLRALDPAGLADDFDLRMGGRVRPGNGAVTARDDGSGFCMDQNRADGHFACGLRFAGFVEGQSHIMFIRQGHTSFYREICATTTA